jgi:hypothetical protein
MLNVECFQVPKIQSALCAAVGVAVLNMLHVACCMLHLNLLGCRCCMLHVVVVVMVVVDIDIGIGYLILLLASCLLVVGCCLFLLLALL